MKKILILLTCVLISQASYSQIFTKIQYLDKFDDCVKNQSIKTLISKTDSTFIIEEKGNKPKEYWITNFAEYNSMGSKDELVDLTGTNVYGYQECWCVINLSDKEEYMKLYSQIVYNHIANEENSSLRESLKQLEKYWLYIVHRTISRYSFEFKYDGEFVWIQDESDSDKLGKDIRRIVYIK